MAVAFVKNHTVASNKTAGTTLALALDTNVPAGNTIVLWMLYDNAATASKPVISSIGVAAGETNAWIFVGQNALSTSTTAGSFASGGMRIIRTTVQWPAGSYTVTLDTSTVQKAGFFQEFSGVLASSAGGGTKSAYSTTTTAASASASGAMDIGDMAVGFIFGSNVAAAQAGSNNTTGGSWSTPVGVGSTGGNAATNNFGVVQYKILTAALAQTYANSAAMTAGNGVLVDILKQYVPPAITQAAYRFYADDAGQAASTALAAQDTSYTADVTAGDRDIQVRVRLQLTTAVATAATDDFQLQYELNTSGTWVDASATGVAVKNDPSTNLLHGGATTNRLGAGTGTFVAGKQATDSLVYDLAITGNNYTELVYSELLKADALANGDTLRFRVLYNGAPTVFTYTQYPTINVTKTLPAVTQAAYRWYDDDAVASTLSDSYSSSNWVAGGGGGLSGTLTAQAQSFLGDGKRLARAGFYLTKGTTPDGTVSAALFAHTGTFGTTGTPTGAALATSTTTLTASSLNVSRTWVYFDFDRTFTLTNGTAYFIAVTSTITTTAPASVTVEGDDTTRTHAGNRSSRSSGGTWTADNLKDLMFEVYTAGSNEATSTPLAAQDTAASGDVSTADGIGQLRVRLQSTNAAPLAATDDWQLQWEKNASGTWTNVVAGPDTVVANYSETNRDSNATYTAAGELYGQSFMGTGTPLVRCGFFGSRTGTPTGTLTARLYAHTGTFGTTGIGTGAVLATSTTTVAASSLGTSNAWVYFTFNGTFTLVNGTPYVIGLTCDVAPSGGTVAFGTDSSSPTHPGIASYRTNAGAWSVATGTDMIFTVSTPVSTVCGYDSPNLTDAAATTNRLTGGTGTFTAGKVSETGLVSNVGWSGNNHTELLYSLDIVNTDVVNGDTLRFRVLRNGVTTGMTFTQTPTINVVKTAPSGGTVKWYNGSAFAAKPVKYWNGSTWAAKPVKQWTGSTWKLTNP